jgi:MFS family permease
VRRSALVPATALISVSDVVTLKERGKYQGILGAFVALANSLGPILGGLFTQKASWRWCFWINLPLSALSLLVIIVLLPLRRVKGGIVGKLKAIDWYGSVLTITWAVLVLLGLSWAGNEYPWASAAVLAPLIIGLALLGVFLLVEWKLVALPLVPLRIFRNSTVAAGMAATLFSGMIFYSTLYYLPTYFQIVRGASPIRSGVLILPLVCVQTVTSFSSGLLVSKTGDYWWNLVFGFAIWTVGCGLLSTFTEDTSLGEIVGFQIIYGVGAGQTFQTSLVAIQASVERKEMATATGFRNFLRMLGGTLALTICSTIVNNISRTRIRQAGLSDDQVDLILSDPTATSDLGLTQAQRLEVTRAYGGCDGLRGRPDTDNSAHAIRSCFYFLIPCSAICLLLTVFFIKRVSLKREDDAAKKAEAKAWVDSKKSKKDSRHDSSTPGDAPDSRRPSATTSDATAHDPAHVEAENSISKKVEGALEDAGREEAEAAGVGSSERAPVVK